MGYLCTGCSNTTEAGRLHACIKIGHLEGFGLKLQNPFPENTSFFGQGPVKGSGHLPHRGKNVVAFLETFLDWKCGLFP